MNIYKVFNFMHVNPLALSNISLRIVIAIPTSNQKKKITDFLDAWTSSLKFSNLYFLTLKIL